MKKRRDGQKERNPPSHISKSAKTVENWSVSGPNQVHFLFEAHRIKGRICLGHILRVSETAPCQNPKPIKAADTIHGEPTKRAKSIKENQSLSRAGGAHHLLRRDPFLFTFCHAHPSSFRILYPKHALRVPTRLGSFNILAVPSLHLVQSVYPHERFAQSSGF